MSAVEKVLLEAVELLVAETAKGLTTLHVRLVDLGVKYPAEQQVFEEADKLVATLLAGVQAAEKVLRAHAPAPVPAATPDAPAAEPKPKPAKPTARKRA